LAGYCYGATFGFLLGTLSLLVSALIGGGVGPWLPYQMFATGWAGLLSGWLPERFFNPARSLRYWEPVLLSAWGGVIGLIFGALMNLWFWPFLTGGPADVTASGADARWAPGMAIWATVRNYLAFYVATSLWWDVGRAGGNVVLLLLLTRPVLRVLRRFRSRFQFDVVPEIIISDTE
jgi:energy-coupling factor transport system substrate-specific component